MRNMKLCSRIAAILMALMLGCQFLPYWHYGAEDAMAASVNGYVWFPHHHVELSDELKAAEEGYSINGVAYPSVLILILCALGAVVGLWKSDSMLACLLPTGCGAFGLWAYLTTSAMKAGSLWWLHVLLLAGMLAMGVLSFIFGFRTQQEDS